MERREESIKRLGHKINAVLANSQIRAFYISDTLLNIEARVKADTTRTRKFWPFFAENMFSSHEKWHLAQGATIIKVDGREPRSIAAEVFNML